MRTTVYAVFERRFSSPRDRLVALFPDSADGVQDAIEWGEEIYGEEEFEAAYAPRGNERAYLEKVHGVEIYEEGEF